MNLLEARTKIVVCDDVIDALTIRPTQQTLGTTTTNSTYRCDKALSTRRIYKFSIEAF
jgi:hypothetical protein